MAHKDMSIYEHIGELRKRLMIVAAFFLAAMIFGLFLSPVLISYLQNIPEAESFPMNVFKLTDSLKLYMNFSFFIGLILVFPLLLYQLWAFVSPGLMEKERKVTLSYIPIATFLFFTGLAFAYFILFPNVIQFLSNLSERLNLTEQYGVNDYFGFLFQLTIPFGFLFQLPVVIMFLTRLGLVTPAWLRKVRKFAYFVLLVLAGLITPPEVVSHLMVTVPLLLLYEISIAISRFSYKKVLKAEQEKAAQWAREDEERKLK
ncbi:sec-independent protein translocase protein TatC [Alteribacillus persepolensis]|uniref:Sec-independent protein translocase protein TatC n=1 Tax=Alteribacillus persepolensis TaxID=568899 RepID=A0A1G8J5I3_9BACI|nr:twin-arginine translocase subunit TatC [Alteribacillus persepolensis]SDI26257.1 sec-independent protein translocase protein TatC [Alteribacillus persepolensis]